MKDPYMYMKHLQISLRKHVRAIYWNISLLEKMVIFR